MQPLVSIIIPTCNLIDITRRCYESLAKTDYKNLEIIFVDNRSLDGTLSYLENLQGKDKRIVLIKNSVNTGCFKARNQALSIARGDIIVFLDNDTQITQPDWLNMMIKHLESDKKIAIVSPKVIYYGSDKIFSAGGGITQDGEPFLLCQGVPRNSKLVSFEREVQYAPATCWVFKRELIEKFGYLDESYLLITFGDIDYCYRLRHNGFKIQYFPKVEIYHEGGITWRGFKLSYHKFFDINSALFKKRWAFMFKKEPFEYFPNTEKYLKDKEATLPILEKSKDLISIILTTRNNLFGLRKTLESLFLYTPYRYELLIIDLGSTDLTPTYLANLHFKNIKVILDKSVNTIHKAKALGRKIASGKQRIFLRAGQILPANWLNKYK